jgi:serpin B
MTHDDSQVTEQLAQLKDGVRVLDWPAPAQLRRSAELTHNRVRRGRVAGLGGVVLAAIAVVLALTLAFPAGPTTSRAGSHVQVRVVTAARQGQASELMAQVAPFRTAGSPAASAAVAAAEHNFAVRLLWQVSRGQSGNVTVSPLSLAVALAMLENGAGGVTRAQIAAVLGAGTISLSRQDQGWAQLLSGLTADGRPENAVFHSADDLWLQRGFPVAPQFLASQARYFRAGVWQTDFERNLPAAENAMNQWASEHTAGTIRHLFGPRDLDASTRVVLANAAGFLGSWQNPFRPQESSPGTFTTSSGRPANVTYMTRYMTGGTVASAGYQAARLPYAGGRFAAVAIMPTDENLARFTATLTPGKLNQIIAGTARGSAASVSLPRFTTGGYLRLNDTLAALGMPVAFSGEADFSVMSPVPLSVQSAVQRDYLSVSEHGTVAYAVTGISLAQSDLTRPLSPALRFDRPFLFLIRDQVTGAILFASLVQNPAA